MPYEYTYPRAAITVDAIVFGRSAEGVHVLLIRRARPPYEGQWALPGGFLDLHETLEEAAIRELEEETGIRVPHMTQLRAFDAVGRDPRERVIAIAHAVVVEMAEHTPHGRDDAAEARWFPLAALPALAFDHTEILVAARAQYEV